MCGCVLIVCVPQQQAGTTFVGGMGGRLQQEGR